MFLYNMWYNLDKELKARPRGDIMNTQIHTEQTHHNPFSIELQAMQFVESYGMIGSPADVIALAGRLDIKVYKADFESSVSGLIAIQQDNYQNFDYNRVIVVNRNLDPTRQRFVIAHELGHYALHRCDGTDFLRMSNLDLSLEELQADEFAMYLLMPVESVSRLLDVLRQRVGSDCSDYLRAKYIAHHFAVPVDIAFKHLRNIGRL